jgi:hypothetical protein
MLIKEIAPNEFMPIGKTTINEPRLHTTTVDGEVYSRTTYEKKDVEVSEYYNVYCNDLDELKCFGYSAKIWDCNSLFRYVSNNYCSVWSTNEYVYYWQWLFENNHLPKWVNNVYTDKKSWRPNKKIEKTFRWVICEYGFNNSLYAEIDWIKLFECENKENYQFMDISEWLSRYGINIFATKETQQINNAIKLLLKQTT